MPPSPTSEAEKVQYTAATCLRVNDGKIISGTLIIITDFTVEMGVEMLIQVEYQQIEYLEHYGVEAGDGMGRKIAAERK